MATSTPWGKSQYVRKLAPGITYYTTPTHGGYKLSDKKFRHMPEALRALASPGFWFEHEKAWAAVALAYPDYFPSKEIVLAKNVVRKKFPSTYAKLYGQVN